MNFNRIGYHIWQKYLEYRLQNLKTVWKFFSNQNKAKITKQ